MIVLIDGDSIAYKAGWAETLALAKQAVDNKMGEILHHTEADSYELYIEEYRHPKANFRKSFDPSYKQKREGKSSPEFLREARDYLVDQWNARIAEEPFESEDIVQVRAKELGRHNVTIAFIDKDLLTQPGHYFNYDTHAKFTNDICKSQYILWKQVLTGDHVDNVPGLPGIGARRSRDIIDPAMGWDDLRLMTARAYKERDLDYMYFITQYNLILIRDEKTTELLYPVTKAEWELV